MKNKLILSFAIILLCFTTNPVNRLFSYAENAKKDPAQLNSKFNLANVPQELLDLVPLAKKWGVGDDTMRAELQQRANDAEKEELKNTLKGRTEQINKWLDSFNQNNPMTDEAGYFLYMLEGLDEMGLYSD